jgi:hypothetical protein
MATVCSCLKYYGRVIIGVARDDDRILVNDMVSLSSLYLSLQHIVDCLVPPTSKLSLTYCLLFMCIVASKVER